MSDLPPVKITLVANGLEGIVAAFKTIEERAKHLEQALSSVQQKAESQRESASRKSSQNRVSAKDKEFAALVRQTEKWGREEVNAEKRKNQQLEADAKRSAAARTGFFNKVAANSVSSMQRVAGTALRLAGAVAAIGGGFSIADALGSEIKNSGTAKTISLNSTKNGVATISKDEALGTAKNVALSHGMTTEDALGGLDAFLAKTGDAKTAKAVLSDLGDLANATGADFKELSTMAGLAWNAMSDEEKKAQGKNGLMGLMRTAVAQGREGAVDIREFANYGTRIFNSAAQFKGGIMENSKFIGSATQMAIEKGTATDAAEATESVKSLGLDVMTHQKQLQEHGIMGTTDSYGNLNNAQTVTEKLLLGTHGNVGELQKVGIERRSIKALEGDAMTFRKVFESETKAGKTKVQAETSAIEAIRDSHKKYMEANYTAADVQRENSERMQEVDKRLAAALERLKIVAGEKLLPEFERLIPKLEALAEPFAKLLTSLVSVAGYIAENPLKSAFIAMSALMMKEVAVAFAASTLTGLMTKMMASATFGPIAIAAATALITAGYLTMQEDSAHDKAKRAGAAEAANESADIKALEGVVKAGPASMSKEDTDTWTMQKQALAQLKDEQSKKVQALYSRKIDEQNTVTDRYSGLFMYPHDNEERKRLENDIERINGYVEQMKKDGIDVASTNRIAAAMMLEAAKKLNEAQGVPYGPPPPPKPGTDGKN